MFVSVCGAMKQKAGGHPLNRFNKHKTALFINWITLKVHMLATGIKKITKLQNMYGTDSLLNYRKPWYPGQ